VRSKSLKRAHALLLLLLLLFRKNGYKASLFRIISYVEESARARKPCDINARVKIFRTSTRVVVVVVVVVQRKMDTTRRCSESYVEEPARARE